MPHRHHAFVHLEFGSAHRAASLAVLAGIARGLPGGPESRSLLIVDNAAQATPGPCRVPGFGDARVVHGDNANREFTGWDRGVAETLARRPEPAAWVFSNDTIARHHGWRRARSLRFGEGVARLADFDDAWLYGHLGVFPRPMRNPAGTCLDYVSTYCFAMNAPLRMALGRLSPEAAVLDSLLQVRYEPGRGLFSDRADPAYAGFVSHWLIPDPAEGDRRRKYKWAHQWQQAAPLGADNFDALRAKARCCISEVMLSVRARKLGADIRTPYDAWNGRDRVERTRDFVLDKLWERWQLRHMR